MANILIVDDVETLALTSQMILAEAGHSAQAVTSGQAALEAIQANSPDLVITDVMMPGMTGLQLLKIVHGRPNWKSIPFLLISASITLEQEGQDALPDNVPFLRKPFEVEVLLETVTEILEAHSK